MFCGKCGKKLQDDSRFCSECGTPVQKNTLDIQSGPVSYFPNHGQEFINQVKKKLSVYKIAVFILSVLGLIFAFSVPYAIVYKAKSSYPLYLTGSSDFPSFLEDDYEAAFTMIFLIFIAETIAIILSCLMEKKTLCLITSIAVGILSFVEFGLLMEMLEKAGARSKSDIHCLPTGAFLQIGITIAIFVMVIKERSVNH